MIRESIANTFIGFGRSIGRLMGLEMAVVASDHSLKAKMEHPDKSKRAWDPDLYKNGNLFISGYANPVKPRIERNPELEEPNTATVRDGDPDGDPEEIDAGVTDEGAELISSKRYQEFMRQNLIEQLLTPESRWNLLVYAIIGVAAIGFVQIIVTLWATGSF